MTTREPSTTAGYKQTDIGAIPHDWDAKAIGCFLDFKNGLNKGKSYFGHGRPIINYMDVYENRGLLSKDIIGCVDVSFQELKSYGVKRGDVFFTRTSETVDEIGMTSVLLDDLKDGVFSGFILRGRPKNLDLEDAFKKYCFSAVWLESKYRKRALILHAP